METNSTIVTLHNLLDFNAGKFTCAENELKKSMPGWIGKADSVLLKGVLQKYLDFTEQHIEKMESFFKEEQFNSIALVNPVMDAFIKETDESLLYCADAAVKDACLLACIQDINHFKISKYGTASAFARDLGLDKAAALFYELEINEKHIDDRLSQLATHEINIKAKTAVLLP
ncbi:DUF892 family protein [Mucilaginibacter sp.]|uniref:YciE/YciF ferroxidase family protein n=1 Tax=Mucilaginibacter sp. TaxID=1882438 RepID=UPI00285018DE|nr:DUF892 family protein [Mucilaginibacter sp.]MDR3694928.1 DUF892 family protein [Mucilaginibacter sp.]